MSERVVVPLALVNVAVVEEQHEIALDYLLDFVRRAFLRVCRHDLSILSPES